MSEAIAVDASISRTPLPASATDLPAVCVPCSHIRGIRVDVEDGRISKMMTDDRNTIPEGYLCNKAFSLARYVDHAPAPPTGKLYTRLLRDRYWRDRENQI
jgi:anaerobic selenocysteine-containing dehydrogenase